MKCTADRIIELARAEIGVSESSYGSNNVKYTTAYYNREINDSAFVWCAIFIWWLFQRADASELYYDGRKIAASSTLAGWFEKKGQLVTGDYRPGDIVFLSFRSRNTIQQVGVVEKVNGDGTLTTIEGGTSPTDNYNGGSVMRRIRSLRNVVGAGRPDYREEGAADTASTPIAGTYRVSSRNGLLVHSGTDKKSTKVGTLPYNSLATVLGRVSDLYIIKYGAITGYCRANGLERVSEEEESAVAGRYRVEISNGLNVRSGPGMNYRRIGSFANNTVVNVTGIRSGWYAVQYDGKTGYCCAKYMTRINSR